MKNATAKAALTAIVTLSMLQASGAAYAQLAAGSAARTDALPVGACINMGNHLEPPSEGAWGRAIADDDFAIIAKAGFKTIRLPVRWTTHLDSADRIDPKFMDRVAKVVGQARAAGLNVILNDHNFEALMTDPDGQKMRLATVWRQIATRFAKEPRDHVWFEIANEPHTKLTNANLLPTLAPALAAIRESNPDRPVIIGGENWSGINSLATLKLPDDPHVVPTVHYYDPFEFTHQGAEWVTPSPKMGREFGTSADKAQLAADVAKLQAYVQRTGKTPFIGEFGAIDKIGREQRVLYMDTVRKGWSQAGIGTCAWAYTNTFPLYDSGSRQWVAGMRAAMGLPEDVGETKAASTPSSAAGRSPALQALDDALPGNLINDPGNLDWPVFGPGATSKPVKTPEAPGGGALQIKTARRGAQIYEVGANAPISAAIKAGQRITVAFYARTIKAETPDEQGVIGVRVQQNIAPYGGFADTTLKIGAEWKLYEVTALADRDIPAGEAVVGFQLAGAKQTIEIGQTIVVEGAASIAGAPAAVATAALPTQLAGKGTLVSDATSFDKWAVYGPGLTSKAGPASGVPGGKALTLTNPAKTAQVHDVGVLVPINAPIAEGDIMIVGVLARATASESADGVARIGLRLQQNAEPYDGFADNTLPIGPTWKLIQLKTQAQIDIAQGQGVVALHFGGARHTVEIAGIYVLNGVAP